MTVFIHPLTICPRFYDPFGDFYASSLAWHQPASMFSPPPPSTESLPDSIKNENGKFIIKFSAPGFLPDDMKLDLEGDKLVLSGVRRALTSFQRMSKIFCIPSGVDTSTFKCTFDSSTHQFCIEASSSLEGESESLVHEPMETFSSQLINSE